MSKPIVIRQVKGAIATIVLYLRRKEKLTPELKLKVISMAGKKEIEKIRKKEAKPKGPNKPND